ncbi:dedicator of cytokinesis protein 2-like protein [Pitangus sulphuratus]|nr:dedicator of cytokinesis protein 2-like protein [Pitangus sulphuratus]
MAPWLPTKEEKYGVAVWNFPSTKEHHLPLEIGETVHILQASEGGSRGPCAFPRVEESVVLAEMPMVQEITTTLREWATIWKQLYVAGQMERYEQVKQMMQELMEKRSQLLSGTLPKDQLLRLRKEVTGRMDYGNKILALDLVVRDEDENILDPDRTSIISLFQAHRRAAQTLTQRIQEEMSPQQRAPGHSTHGAASPSHSLYLCVRNFVCHIGEEAQLFMALYDPCEQRIISENYVIRWASTGVPQDIELLNNLKVVFTDLGSTDLKRERLFLVCQIIRVGRMDLRDTHSRKLSTGLRRPFGISVMDITDITKGTCDSDEDKQHFIPVHLVAADSDFLHNMIRKAVEGKDINHKGQGDVRNDIYLTLVQGEFDKGNKKTQKNVEVTVCVCDEAGSVVQNVIQAGAGDSPTSHYRSVVYYQQRHQRWMETLKGDSRKLEDASAYLSLPSERNLSESKLLSGSSFRVSGATSGLSASTRDSFQISTLVCSTKLTQNVNLLGLLKWRSKPSLLRGNLQKLMNVDGGEVIKVQLGPVLYLPSWLLHPQSPHTQGWVRYHAGVSAQALTGLSLPQFLQDTLDALFCIMMEHSDTDVYDTLVFDALVFIVGLVADRKFQHFNTVLEAYICQHFSATLAYKKLLSVLTQYVEQAGQGEPCEPLPRTFKALEYIFKFIVRSRHLFAQLYGGKETAEFQRSLQRFFLALNQLMESPLEGPTLLSQGAALKYLPSILEDVFGIFDSSALGAVLRDFVGNLPPQRLLKQKLQSLTHIARSRVFQSHECRELVLQAALPILRELIQAGEEEDACIELLSSILEVLYQAQKVRVKKHIQVILERLLHTVSRRVIVLDRENPLRAV